MIGLGWLPGANALNQFSTAERISLDGSVIVGESDSASGRQAFRWTQEAGMIGLGFLPGFNSRSMALGVSADGTKVFGNARNALGQFKAFIWDAVSGMRSVAEVLMDAGLDVAGWELTAMRGISVDGLTLTGTGINPLGNFEAWIADLSPSSPGSTPEVPLLPTPDPSNPSGFTFSDVEVTPNGLGISSPIYIDPVVALGYDYAVTGGPIFASVLIPKALPKGDSMFTLELPGYGDFDLVSGTPFNFLGVDPNGFGSFRITGIDPEEMLDPTDPTAFVTGLTFTGPGTVTIRQNPISGGAAVPSPVPALGIGVAFSWSRRLRERIRAQEDC
jgi:probable HAF family extracellular repeat protein